jgi:NAD(P)-dependent dehydrogenase (short-subunit alcohol dehydrogenase family)
MQRLKGKVAVVTGASRGAGRGIALVLGSEGATVYVTGRTVRNPEEEPDPTRTTIHDTAEGVTARGGRGIPIRTDHTRDEEIIALFDQVNGDAGRVDILVNNAWGGYENYRNHGADPSFDAVFWEQPLTHWDTMIYAGVRASLATTYYALPLMFSQRSGVIFNTTLEMDPLFYDAALFYRTAKVTLNYMTLGMAHDLHKRGGYEIAVVGLAMGWMRTEKVLQNFSNGVHDPREILKTESVEFGGRAAVALATDPDIMRKSGRVLRTRDLAHEYGFVDVDGRQPD